MDTISKQQSSKQNLSFNNLNWLTFVLTTIILIWSSSIWAAPELKGQLEALLVSTDSEGVESFTAAESVFPGQIIEYRLVYSNEGDEGINNLSVLGPIPAGVGYVEDSASSIPVASLEATIDNGETWSSEPLYRTVTDANGEEVQEVVSPSQYQQIRWISSNELQPESSFNYTYRVRVNDDAVE